MGLYDEYDVSCSIIYTLRAYIHMSKPLLILDRGSTMLYFPLYIADDQLLTWEIHGKNAVKGNYFLIVPGGGAL